VLIACKLRNNWTSTICISAVLFTGRSAAYSARPNRKRHSTYSVVNLPTSVKSPQRKGIYPEYDAHDNTPEAAEGFRRRGCRSEQQTVPSKPVSVCDGSICGPNRRPMVPLEQSRSGFSALDVRSPWAFVSAQAST